MSSLLQQPHRLAAETPTPAPATVGPTRATLRLGGLAGLAFAFGLLVQNAVLLAGAPLPSASQQDIIAFYTDHATSIGIATGWVAANLAFVVTFVHVAAARLAQHAESRLWAGIARSAVALLGAIFGVTTILQATLAATMPQLATEPAVLAALWNMHTAAFALGGAGLGILLGSLSLGARHVGLVPRWMAHVGLVGAALLLVGAAGLVNAVNGGPVLWSIMGGFACWVLFLVMAGWRMTRAKA